MVFGCLGAFHGAHGPTQLELSDFGLIEPLNSSYALHVRNSTKCTPPAHSDGQGAVAISGPTVGGALSLLSAKNSTWHPSHSRRDRGLFFAAIPGRRPGMARGKRL